ncbi:FtsX-like permease family protein [compost metagenome]
MSPLKIAFLHLVRRRVSSLIAILGIAIAVSSSGVLLRLYHLSSARFSSLPRAGDAIVGAKTSGLDILLGSLNLEGDYPDFIPLNLFMTLKAEVQIQFEDGARAHSSFIETIIPFVTFAQKGHFRIIGTEESFIKSGRHGLPELASGQWPALPGEVLLGVQAADKLGLKEGDLFQAPAWTDKNHNHTPEHRFKVVGLLKPTGKSWDRGIYSNLATAHHVFADSPVARTSIWKANVLHYFIVYLKPGGASWIESLINQRTVGQVVFVDQEIAKLEKLTGTGRDLGLVMSIIVLILGAFTVTAMMITRFESMTAQLAVLRALGFSKFQLTGVMLGEALLLGLVACLLGATLDALAFPWIRELLGNNLPSAELVAMPLWQSAPVWIAALLGTLCSILIPLWRLYRQDLHLSLRNL